MSGPFVPLLLLLCFAVRSAQEFAVKSIKAGISLRVHSGVIEGRIGLRHAGNRRILQLLELRVRRRERHGLNI